MDRVDTTVAHPARRYNYWLGGKDHFAADRASGDAIEAAMPSIRTMALENRRFLGRAARLIASRGVRQFLDIGTGIPAPGNTHEVVQAVDPASKIVYVDNDPIVLSHARALLTSAPAGSVAYLDADLRNTRSILDHTDLKATIDLTEPVGLLLIAVLHFIRDDEDVTGIVRTLLDALPPGSYVAATHATWEYLPAEAVAKLTAANPDGRFQARDGADFARLFDGLELVDPGVASVAHWHAQDEPQPRPAVEDVACNGFVARVP
ncbi:SAM-dependent methyltransferase [Paractinoplanes atraurantiacus]|uniref:SAM-dependent methyltransferase n=1 Tax=Paractinoplanes atraurantiacus TaxID=1036182 RepID=UPI000BE22F70|nr:SAM-dependent methyltransferase [Actinoplanes atraurantiacus]